LNVRIDVDSDGTPGDELGSFVLRTTGFNTIRTIAARLRYLHALSGGLLSTLPLELRLRGKSTTLSHRTPIYYVDLTLRGDTTLAQAVSAAKAAWEARRAAGVDQGALEEAAQRGFALGEFEESDEDGVTVVEEFYPADEEIQDSGSYGRDAGGKPELVERLRLKARNLPPAAERQFDRSGQRIVSPLGEQPDISLHPKEHWGCPSSA
jgi:hypothetical protein